MLVTFILIVVVTSALTLYLEFVRKRRAIIKLFDLIEENVDTLANSNHNKVYDILAKKGDTAYLFKMLYNYDKDEISINSKKYFQKNHGAIASKTQGTQMKNCYDLMNYDPKPESLEAKKVVKIYVICPTSKNLIRVVNECEVVNIKPSTDVLGCRFLKFDHFSEEFKEVLKEDIKDEI